MKYFNLAMKLVGICFKDEKDLMLVYMAAEGFRKKGKKFSLRDSCRITVDVHQKYDRPIPVQRPVAVPRKKKK